MFLDKQNSRIGQLYVDGDERSEERKVIICGGCKHRVADADAKTEVSGRHEHTCVNPSGIVYRIRCFSAAAGCAGHGETTDYFSWFSGYAWQIGLCAKCHMHLGWLFTGDEAPFVGLIADRIEEVTREL